MKKTIFFTILTLLALSSYTQDVSNRSIFIEGSSFRHDHFEFFYVNFRKEAVGIGTSITDVRENAAYIFKFAVSENPYAGADGNQFLLTISLINNQKNEEILSIDFYYDNLEEMYEHTNYLFFTAVSIIPPLTEAALLYEQSWWKYKWIYLRASFDYPVSFFVLQSDGLFAGAGTWVTGPSGDPSEIMPLDNKIFALPGITLGAEFHFLDFLSAEVNFKLNTGDLIKYSLTDKPVFNFGIDTRLKFPFKYFRLFVIEPYAQAFFPLVTSDVYKEYPSYFLGGGIQLNTKGGKNGAFFVDVNYMVSFKDAVINNPYSDRQPPVIHYRPSILGISVGYKHGFINRPRKPYEHPIYCDCGQHIIFPVHEPEIPEEEPEEPAPPERPRRPANSQIFYF